MLPSRSKLRLLGSCNWSDAGPLDPEQLTTHRKPDGPDPIIRCLCWSTMKRYPSPSTTTDVGWYRSILPGAPLPATVVPLSSPGRNSWIRLFSQSATYNSKLFVTKMPRGVLSILAAGSAEPMPAMMTNALVGSSNAFRTTWWRSFWEQYRLLLISTKRPWHDEQTDMGAASLVLLDAHLLTCLFASPLSTKISLSLVTNRLHDFGMSIEMFLVGLTLPLCQMRIFPWSWRAATTLLLVSMKMAEGSEPMVLLLAKVVALGFQDAFRWNLGWLKERTMQRDVKYVRIECVLHETLVMKNNLRWRFLTRIWIVRLMVTRRPQTVVAPSLSEKEIKHHSFRWCSRKEKSSNWQRVRVRVRV